MHDCPGCGYMHYCSRTCEANDLIHKENVNFPTECKYFKRFINETGLLSDHFQEDLLRLYFRVLIRVQVNDLFNGIIY